MRSLLLGWPWLERRTTPNVRHLYGKVALETRVEAGVHLTSDDRGIPYERDELPEFVSHTPLPPLPPRKRRPWHSTLSRSETLPG